MNVRGLTVAFALFAYPREFRTHFGDQICADVEEGGDSFIRLILDILKNGCAMRIDVLFRDLSYAVRRLRSAPLFVAIVVGTFALGIGANVAVFSVLHSVVLSPLPFPNQDRIVAFTMTDERRASAPDKLSIPDVNDLRARLKTVQSIAAIAEGSATLMIDGHPHNVSGPAVQPEFFDILGIHPEIGRFLVRADSRPGVHNIVISDRLWHRYFGGTVDVLGRHATLDGVSYTIVGVMPPETLLPVGGALDRFDHVEAQDETAPPRDHGTRYLEAIGLLAPGQSLAKARAEVRSASLALKKQYPDFDATFDVNVEPLATMVVGNAAPQLWTIFAAVLGILLIACANVANLIAARWSVRDREVALRRAVGAPTSRIAAQLLVETGVLSILGGIAGIVLAYGALHWLSAATLSTLPRGGEIQLDWAALVYGAVVVVLTTLLAGFSPMITLARSDLQLVLKSAGRGGDASAGHALRAGLVVMEIALALALVTVSGLVVRSYVDITRTPLGIRPAGLSETGFYGLSFTGPTGTPAGRARVQSALLERLKALPGIDSAALAVTYPLGDVSLHFDLEIFGKSYPAGHEPDAAGNDVSPGYFATLGIPILRGRDFTADDSMRSQPVTIVNQRFVDVYLKGTTAIGQRVRIPGWNGTKSATTTIVGIVGNERTRLSMPSEPHFYAPIAQAPPSMLAAIVHRTSLDAPTASREIKAAFADVIPQEEPPEVYTVDERIAQATTQARSVATLLTILAVIALVLALTGIYGVVSFSVSQRAREFGVRLAMGAADRDLLSDVLRRSLSTTAIGLAIGVVIAACGALAIAPQLQSVSPFDPVTFAVVITLILTSAVAAAIVPAIRAMRTDPAIALRYE